MKRKFYIVILLALLPTFVHALGLGNLDLNSALNEPFDARIKLLSPTADELDSMKIGLADSEAFARAKIDRPFILSKLKFTLRRSPDDGPDYIRVFSQEPIREPFLNFLIEVSWSNGRLFREYTVLLDPPLYDPNARASEFKKPQPKPVVPAPEPEAVSEPAEEEITYADVVEQTTTATPASPDVDYAGGDYGPTDSSDTLWSVASKMRPDSSISVNQMMMALLRANPDAFVNQNINGLKRGQILRMPEQSEIAALNNAQALAEAQSQHAAWGNVQDSLTSDVAERPEVSSVPEPAEEVVAEEAAEESEAELKLVAPDEDAESTEQVASAESGAGNELILAQELIQALTQENIELNDKLQESEALLADLKRLLSLKDDELAALQEQAATDEVEEVEEVESGVVEDELEEAAEEIVAEDEFEEVAEEEVVEELADEAAEEAEAEEELAVVEDEVIDVIETEPETSSDGIMGMVEQYLDPVKEILLGNPMIGMAVGAVLVVLILIVVIMKFRKKSSSEEGVPADAMTEEAFPDFDSGDLGDTGEEELDSEAVTIIPDAEAETALPEEPAADDLGDIEEEEKTQFIAEEEAAPAEEQEPEEDPLQEVNTYLAFEQFDQAEEFVRSVIETNPDNPEYHTKLLEVFYTSGNKKSYEETAKVLHDLVNGDGEHWNMAVAMWQEMSPSRALFEEGGEDDDSAAVADSSGGFVDVTADDESADDDNALDFDLGGAEEEADSAVAEAATEDVLDVTAAVGLDADEAMAEDAAAEDEMLDISGGSADSEELLDVTGGNESEEMLDVTGASADSEEMLDITGDSGDSEELLDITGDSGDSEEVLDVTGASADSEEMLDVTGSSAETEDLLDITSGEESSGEDLLDVTAVSDLELDSEEDLLDVTAATSAGADSSELLGLDIEPDAGGLELDVADDGAVGADETVEMKIDASADAEVATDDADTGADDNVLDFDIGTNDDAEALEVEVAEPEEDAGLEMDLEVPDTASADEVVEDNSLEMELDVSADDTAVDDLDMSLDISEDDTPIQLDVEEPEASEVDGDISLGLDIGADDGLELDLSADADEAPEIELDIAGDSSEEQADDAGMDFDLSLDDSASSDDSDLDLEGTVEMPKSVSLDVSGDDDDDDDDHTVFVPRAAQPEEQSAEDEIATKLDLAKAYVELGDKESAKTILDEVIAEGNDEQRKQAQELLD